MKDSPTLQQTVALSVLTQLEERRLDGSPAVYHIFEVAKAVRHLGENYETVALLHDIVEDTDTTIDDLVGMNYRSEVTVAVDFLTHRKGVNYMEYIQEIIDSESDLAIQVKIADLKNNLGYSVGKPEYDSLARRYRLALKTFYFAGHKEAYLPEFK